MTPVRTPLASDVTWLTAAFAVPGATINSVAAEAGCNPRTIKRWQKRHGVSSRSLAEHASARQAMSGALPAETLRVIDGELLGDGSLRAWTRHLDGPIHAAAYHHSTNKEEYLHWLAERLVGLESTVGGPILRSMTTVNGDPLWRYALRTRSHAELATFYRRWYRHEEGEPRRKIVPPDLTITPTVALHWYLGDGWVSHNRDRPHVPYLALATHGFQRDEVERLADLMAGFDARVYKQRQWWFLRLMAAQDFLDYIGPCPLPDAYGHRWRLR